MAEARTPLWGPLGDVFRILTSCGTTKPSIFSPSSQSPTYQGLFQPCTELNSVSPKFMSFLQPQNMIIFGNSAFAHVISWEDVILEWGEGVLILYDWHSYKKNRKDTDVKGEHQVMMNEVVDLKVYSQGMPRMASDHQTLEGTRESSPLEYAESLLTPWFQTSLSMWE